MCVVDLKPHRKLTLYFLFHPYQILYNLQASASSDNIMLCFKGFLENMSINVWNEQVSLKSTKLHCTTFWKAMNMNQR